MKFSSELSDSNDNDPVTGCFLPDFCNIRVTFAVIIAAELLAVVLSIASYTSQEYFWERLGMLSLYIQWIALGSNAALCTLKPVIKNLSAGLSGLTALAVMLLITGLLAHISYTMVISEETSLSYQAFLLQSLLVSFIIGVLSLHYFYMDFRLGQQQQAEAEAKFQALQARIRPHFLFNSMNTIAHLTRADPEMAEAVVENLADLFRATLENPDRLSTLGQEIELAKGYLNIESMRLGDRLQVSWQIDDSLERVQMPSMMLQPLLENAVYHGIEVSAEGGLINVTVKQSGNIVSIEISNTVSHSGKNAGRKGNHMAQDNIRKRLQAFFGEKAYFEIEDDKSSYSIRMQFPVNQ